jgi:thioredoxin reductase (NADPH)
MHNVIIIGSGCAGLTAAIYTARANLAPLIIAGAKSGGQLALTTEVENFPGFPAGILGPTLIDNIKRQAERFGAKYLKVDAVSVDFSGKPFKILTSSETLETKAVIIASGASAIWLGLESEQRFIGKGVSSCATCDGYFFTNKNVVVIGGGDAAIEEATFLTKFADNVIIVHRRDALRASKIMQDRALSNPKISFKWSSALEEVLGQDFVTGVKIKNINSGEVEEIKIDGVFVSIGHKPNTEIFKGQIDLDVKGYIVATNETKTSVDGIFVAGDVQDHVYRQAITAAGLGCRAAIDVEKYLASSEK